MRHVIRLKLTYAQHELKKLEHKGMLIDCLIKTESKMTKSGPRKFIKDQLCTGSHL